MHLISYVLVALLSLSAFVTADETELPELEQAMMTIVTRVRQEQVSRSATTSNRITG